MHVCIYYYTHAYIHTYALFSKQLSIKSIRDDTAIFHRIQYVFLPDLGLSSLGCNEFSGK